MESHLSTCWHLCLWMRWVIIIINHEAGEVIRLVTSICLSIRPFVPRSNVWTVRPMTSSRGYSDIFYICQGFHFRPDPDRPCSPEENKKKIIKIGLFLTKWQQFPYRKKHGFSLWTIVQVESPKSAITHLEPSSQPHNYAKKNKFLF